MLSLPRRIHSSTISLLMVNVTLNRSHTAKRRQTRLIKAYNKILLTTVNRVNFLRTTLWHLLNRRLKMHETVIISKHFR